MSNINAESVKAKLQGLITSANAKTGKSDANLTDAVKTLLEGYGKGGGGGGDGECSGKHIIEVDELPAVGVEGAIYSVKGFGGVVLVFNNSINITTADDAPCFKATTETYQDIVVDGMAICYITDIPDVYVYQGGTWMSFSGIYAAYGLTLTYLGEITEPNTADVTTNGYYAYISTALYKYTNGQFKALFEKGGLEYSSNGDGTCAVTGVERNNYDTDISIPSVAPNGDSVTSIRISAFEDCSSLTSVTIPDSVTYIGSNAFRNCRSLTSITIPDGVTSINSSTFEECRSLTSITIPDGVTRIENMAFQNCRSLTSVNLPKGLTDIISYLFDDCRSLTSITIPDGVTRIDIRAFQNCRSLTSITIPNSVTLLQAYAFINCSGLTSITIPNSVIDIRKDLFKGCSSLASITFDGTVEQWNAIDFVDGWLGDAPATKVVCSDGEVTL